MPTPAIRLKEVRIFGTNHPASGLSFHIGPVLTSLERGPGISIGLTYELAEKNRFVVVPSIPNTRVKTRGSNDSQSFEIELNGEGVEECIRKLGRQERKAGIARVLHPYLLLTRQLRVEAANDDSTLKAQGFVPMDSLMQINNLAVYGLQVPYAASGRSYMIDGVQLEICRPNPHQKPRIETIVKLPSRQYVIAIREGYQRGQNPALHLSWDTAWNPYAKSMCEVSLTGDKLARFLERSSGLKSPREVWKAISPYYTCLRSNFRIKCAD